MPLENYDSGRSGKEALSAHLTWIPGQISLTDEQLQATRWNKALSPQVGLGCGVLSQQKKPYLRQTRALGATVQQFQKGSQAGYDYAVGKNTVLDSQ